MTQLSKKRVNELVSVGKGERFDHVHGGLMKEGVAVWSGKAISVELAKNPPWRADV